MKIGDRFPHALDEATEIEYEVCTLADLMGFLERGGTVVPFEDVLRCMVGFARGEEGRAVTFAGLQEDLHVLSPRLREEICTPAGRARIAAIFSR